MRWLVIGAIALIPAYASADEISDRLTALEKRVTALEQAAHLSLSAVAPSNSPTSQVSVPKETIQSKEATVLLSLTNWDYAPKKGDFQNYYLIKYTLKNGYDKTIKLIDGSIEFSDILGENVYGIRMDKDVKIAPGKDAGFSGNYPRFGTDAERMASMSKSDIRAEVHVRAIVFDDNSVLRIGE